MLFYSFCQKKKSSEDTECPASSSKLNCLLLGYLCLCTWFVATTCMLTVPSPGNDRHRPELFAGHATSQGGCGKRVHFLLSADIHCGTDRQSHIDRISTGSRRHACSCGTCHDLNQVGCDFVGSGRTDLRTDLIGVRSR